MHIHYWISSRRLSCEIDLTFQRCNSLLDIFKNGLKHLVSSLCLWSVPTSLRAWPPRSSTLSFVTNSLDCLIEPWPWLFFSISNGSQRAEGSSIVRREQGKVAYLMFLVGRNGCNYLWDVQCLRLNAQWIFPWFFQIFRYFPLLLVFQSFLFSFWNATPWKTWPYLFFLWKMKAWKCKNQEAVLFIRMNSYFCLTLTMSLLPIEGSLCMCKLRDTCFNVHGK